MTATRTVTLENKYGLHMRPAKKIIDLANQFDCSVRITASLNGREEVEIDGKSIMELIGLAAVKGTRLGISCSGPDAERAVKEITDLVKSFPQDYGE